MTAITLTLPDDLAARLAALPDDARNAFATATLAAGLDSLDKSNELSADDLAAIGAGLAALDAGQVTPGPVAFAELRAHLDELRQNKQQAEQQAA